MVKSLVSKDRAWQVQLSNHKIGTRTISGGMQKAVLIALATHGLTNSERELARTVGTTRRTLRYALQALHEQRLIDWGRPV